MLSFLRREVLSRFKESMKDPEYIRRNLEEEKRRKKEFSLHWKYLPPDMKKRLLLLGKSWFMQDIAIWSL